MADSFGLKNLGRRKEKYAMWNSSNWNAKGLGNSLGSFYDPGNYFGWDDQEEDPYAGMPGGSAPYLGMEMDQLNIPIEWDRRAEGKLNDEALRTGLSKNNQLALDLNAKGVTQAKSNVRGQAAGLEAQARTNLAMKGGMDSGAAERIAKNSQTNALDLTQQAEAGGNANAAGIRMKDEDQRLAGLDNAAGMNMNAAQAMFGMKNANLKNVVGETDRRNAYNMNNYNQQMAAWGAGKQAQATEKSGGKK